MLCSAPPSLRAVATGYRLTPRVSGSTYYSTAPLLRPDVLSPRLQKAPFLKHHITPIHFPKGFSISIRAASTTSETSPLAQNPPAASSAASTPSEVLDWNTFFKLRKKRRLAQLTSSGGFSAVGLGGGALTVMADLVPESFLSQMPIEPLVTLGVIVFICGGLGWLVGPTLGGALYNWNIGKTRKAQMAEKEIEFFRRVKKYRVDPTGGSVANPVPDYYGEKIASVAGYRQWLKDQRSYNKKRLVYV